jgi:excisionase family DNA binding protein
MNTTEQIEKLCQAGIIDKAEFDKVFKSSDKAEIEKLYTTDEVASMLRVHPVTVKRWVLDGRIDSIKIGGCRRVKASTVAKVIDHGI